ncbi:MAG: RnfABCDGE type electron transport complex subunit B [Gammaproteobacteria bacterium]|nr:RnfABCDGE type electron transport complex subunit B [Gammaproteobacteria bacterium]MCH9716882.1 RnfABCDGE type electron transport complex subunit B [Gammaproteobacteria bacterium]MCH9764236.1 RnfABCDGE type electron transport complex subunit B [Gammaproteobacteria bacterium]
MSKINPKTLDAVLPQTQCGECGYPGCLPYAEALAHGQATIDCCPPGGLDTLHALGRLLDINPEPYRDAVIQAKRPPQTAIIREAECIGCTKCIPACPVDAIIGSAKQMHDVLPHECTGCGLCVEPCPVDCIDLVEIPEDAYDKNTARDRFQAKKIRELRETQAKEKLYQDKRHLIRSQKDSTQEDAKAKRAYILSAMARVKKQ